MSDDRPRHNYGSRRTRQKSNLSHMIFINRGITYGCRKCCWTKSESRFFCSPGLGVPSPQIEQMSRTESRVIKYSAALHADCALDKEIAGGI